MCRSMSAVDARFWSKVEKGDDEWHCWEWTGAERNGFGYGAFWHGGRHVQAHRIAYRLSGSHPVEPEVVLHLCDNPKCCNPLHLRGGSQAENMADKRIKGRSASGEDNGSSRLTWADVLMIRRDERPNTVIAAELGVHHSTVSRARNGERW